jgi:uncharacterized protein
MRRLSLILVLVLSGYIPAAAQTQAAPPPAVRIPSGKAVMFGSLYPAEGGGPRPTILLLHGHPGGSVLGRVGGVLDLAVPLQRAGFNVVVFNFRGAWGSSGTYGLPQRIEDVKAAMEFARAEKMNVDPAKVSLVGHSAGGFNALLASVEEPNIHCTAGIAPANLGGIIAEPIKKLLGAGAAVPGRPALDVPVLGLSGYTEGDFLREIATNQPRFDVAARMGPLKGRPLLIVQATQDTTVRAEHVTQYVAAARAVGAAPFNHVQIDADHNFTLDGNRKELADVVAGWMTRHCK